MTEKTILVVGTRTLANGEKKKYMTKKTYVCKGYVHADGSRKQKIVLTEEQIADARYKLGQGIKKGVICKELGCSYPCFNKALGIQ